jgi:hypothetical protein
MYTGILLAHPILHISRIRVNNVKINVPAAYPVCSKEQRRQVKRDNTICPYTLQTTS